MTTCRAAAVALIGAVAVAASACTGAPAAEPVPTAGQSATVSRQLESRAVDAAGDRLTMTMTPLIRSGDAVVLTILTRLDRAADGSRSEAVTRHFSSILATSFDNVRLVDEGGRRVYTVAEDAGGNCSCTGLQRFAVGETRPLQAVFTGVPAAVTRLDVVLPYAGVFFDVPLAGGVIPAPPSAGGPDRQDPLDLADHGRSYAADLDAYTARADLGLSTRRTPQRVDISLDADVLFRLDSAQLTPAAARSVGAAVAELKGAAPGPLGVTGHTDDSGSSAHNQALSEQRARTVAAELAESLPDALWPKVVAGKGETEPVAANDSAAHRRLNRRVTISFQATRAAPAENQGAETALPRTKGVRGTAATGVEVALPLRRGTVRFTPGAATVHGPFLQVDLVATNIGADKATILDYLGQGAFTARDEFDPYAPYGASGVRLLDGDTAYYGLDYLVAKGGHRCLCDRLLNQAIPPGSAQRIALWFPAPATGTTTVTLDVADEFRITGVPVS